jgi:hypothetical protein
MDPRKEEAFHQWLMQMEGQGKLMGHDKAMKEWKRVVAIREAIEAEGVDVMPFIGGKDGAYKEAAAIKKPVNARLKEKAFESCQPNTIAREMRRMRDAIILARKYPPHS